MIVVEMNDVGLELMSDDDDVDWEWVSVWPGGNVVDESLSCDEGVEGDDGDGFVVDVVVVVAAVVGVEVFVVVFVVVFVFVVVVVVVGTTVTSFMQ